MSHGMGHKLKMAKHKLISKVKKDGVEMDEDYEREQERFVQHVSDAMRVRDEIHGYVNAMKSMGGACEGLGDAVAMYYRSSKPDNIPKAGEVFQSVQSKIGQKTTQSMEADFQDTVLKEWTEYCGFLQALKAKITERQEKLEQYDYYKKKVAKMKENVNAKDANKLPQNEQKLEATKVSFEEINTELKEVFALICDDADNAFHPQLHKMVLGLTDLHQRLSFLSGELKAINSSPEEYGCPISNPKFKPLVAHYGVAPLQGKPRKAKPASSLGSAEGPAALAAPVPAALSPSDEESDFVAINDKEDRKEAAGLFGADDGINTTSSGGGGGGGGGGDGARQAPGGLARGNHVRALFTFHTDNEDELPFEEGDELVILEESEEGWWKAEKDGRQGMIPHNYVEPI